MDFVCRRCLYARRPTVKGIGCRSGSLGRRCAVIGRRLTGGYVNVCFQNRTVFILPVNRALAVGSTDIVVEKRRHTGFGNFNRCIIHLKAFRYVNLGVGKILERLTSVSSHHRNITAFKFNRLQGRTVKYTCFKRCHIGRNRKAC